MSMTTRGASSTCGRVQKSLNQMSRDERIEFIRASGDPQDLGAHRGARRRPARRAAAAVAGRREPAQGAHQVVRLPHVVGRRRRADAARARPTSSSLGEAQVKRLSMRLAASGLVVTKYALNVVDDQVHRSRHRRGDLLQHDVADGPRQLGQRSRSAAGDRHEDRRRILAQLLPAARHRDAAARSRSWSTGMPDAGADDALLRELVGLPARDHRDAAAPARSRASTTCSSRAAAPAGDLVAAGDPEAAQRQARTSRAFALGRDRRRGGQRRRSTKAAATRRSCRGSRPIRPRGCTARRRRGRRRSSRIPRR